MTVAGSFFWNVPIVQQSNSNLCWFACFQMIFQWGGYGSVLDPATNNTTLSMYNNNQQLQGSDVPNIAPALGYTYLYASLDTDGLANLLAKGPIMYLGVTALTPNPHGHAVLINGISQNLLAVVDPWDAQNYTFSDADAFLGKVLPQSGSSSLIYPP